MDPLDEYAVKNLREAREELLRIPADELTGSKVTHWMATWKVAFDQAQTQSGVLMQHNIGVRMSGLQGVMDTSIMGHARASIVGVLDNALGALDRKEPIRPVLDEYILRVKDSKLATLLREFNQAKDATPNLAAIGFRTIVAMIARERAQRKNPTSALALRTDIVPELMIKEAVEGRVFERAEARLLDRFLSGGDKDRFDNVCHKFGANALIDKDALADAIKLLNSLLPTIVD